MTETPIRIGRALAVLLILAATPGAAQPPFGGTVWISRDVITEADPSALAGIEYTGRGERVIWDYRVLEWITVDAYLFEAGYPSAGAVVEFQVNPEFGSVDAARAAVDGYAAPLGRMPAVLLSRLEKAHVNAGNPDRPDALRIGPVRRVFGGNWHDRSITIHTGYGQEVIDGGFIEEILIHEGAHASLQHFQDDPDWRAAQEADGEFISTYARDYPDGEDVAESVLVYFAVRFVPERLRAADRGTILATIPNRLEYFDELALNWSPYTPTVSSPNQPPVALGVLPDVRLPELRATQDVDVSQAFNDPDGDALTYGATSSALHVATVRAAGARVTLTAVGEGMATIRVTATDPGGLSAIQSFTATVSTAVSVPFTDDPLQRGVTPVKAVHFTELRTRIDALRSAAGLLRFSWTDPVLRAGVTRVRGVHLLELRSALAEAYSAAGRPAPRWTEASPASGSTPIRALHVTELRAAVLALE